MNDKIQKPLRLHLSSTSKSLYEETSKPLFEAHCIRNLNDTCGNILGLKVTYLRDSTKTSIWGGRFAALACKAALEPCSTIQGTAHSLYLQHHPEIRNRLAPLIAAVQCDERVKTAIENEWREWDRPDMKTLYLDAMLFPDAVIVTMHRSLRWRDDQLDRNHRSIPERYPEQNGLMIVEDPISEADKAQKIFRITELWATYEAALLLPYGTETEMRLPYSFEKSFS